jgi:hypothetical protein
LGFGASSRLQYHHGLFSDGLNAFVEVPLAILASQMMNVRSNAIWRRKQKFSQRLDKVYTFSGDDISKGNPAT